MIKSEPKFDVKSNPCPECDGTNLEPRRIVTDNWRGWVVECLDCGTITEYNDGEPVAEHRSA